MVKGYANERNIGVVADVATDIAGLTGSEYQHLYYWLPTDEIRSVPK
jgi:hypothetical protein